MSKKIDHAEVRIFSNPQEEKIPPEGEREDTLLVGWAESLYANTMRITSAGVLSSLGSLDKAASVLWWAGYQVPPGYFPDDHEGAGYEPGTQEALRLWVEEEAVLIEQTIETVGFYLAGRGKLLDKADKYHQQDS